MRRLKFIFCTIIVSFIFNGCKSDREIEVEKISTAATDILIAAKVKMQLENILPSAGSDYIYNDFKEVLADSAELGYQFAMHFKYLANDFRYRREFLEKNLTYIPTIEQLKNIHEYVPKKSLSNYKIIETDVYESDNKAQLLVYVHYLDTGFAENLMAKVLEEVYYKVNDKSPFKNFAKATHIGVKLYSGATAAKKAKSQYLCELTKLPQNKTYSVTYNKTAIKFMQEKFAIKKSPYLQRYEELDSILQVSGTSICEIYWRVDAYELTSIRLADEKHPNFDYPEHMDYLDVLRKKEMKRIMKEFQITEDLYYEITSKGFTNCR